MSTLSPNPPLATPLLRGLLLAAPAVVLSACVAQVGVEAPVGGYVAPGYVAVQAREAPPPLPDYDQPPCPEDGYLWTPGYWSWGGGGYFWVPGTWVQPPRVGVLWTPGYWGFAGGLYAFHAGYWGPHVGFYGGVNYGFGYTGVGFAGGAWQGSRYAYNRAVTNVNVTIVHNTYNTTVINNVTVNRVSYNGGAAGIAAAPSAQDRQVAREQHVAATPMQQQHSQQAAQNPALFARANGGHPAIAATPRPAAFNAPGIVGARGAARAQGPQTEAQTAVQGRGQFQNQPPSQPQSAAQSTPQTPPSAGQAPVQQPNQARAFTQRQQPPNQAQGGRQSGQGPRPAQNHSQKKEKDRSHPKKHDDGKDGGR